MTDRKKDDGTSSYDNGFLEGFNVAIEKMQGKIDILRNKAANTEAEEYLGFHLCILNMERMLQIIKQDFND